MVKKNYIGKNLFRDIAAKVYILSFKKIIYNLNNPNTIYFFNEERV
jgi:hypothetical protein